MRSLKLPIFRELDLDELDNWYDAQVEVEGSTVSMDLNFDETTAEESQVQPVQTFLEQLNELNQTLRQNIAEDFKTGTTTREFLSKVNEFANQEKLNTLLTGADPSLTRDEQLLSFLRLKRVGFFPEDAERFAMVDYTIGYEVTDFLLAFTLSAQTTVVELTVENY